MANTTTGAKRRRSPAQNAYTNLVKAKAKFCRGTVAKSVVKAQAANYVAAATKAGKPAGDAKKTAERVLASGCSMSSSIAGRKRKKATTKKAASITARKRKKTTATRAKAPRRKRVAA